MMAAQRLQCGFASANRDTALLAETDQRQEKAMLQMGGAAGRQCGAQPRAHTTPEVLAANWLELGAGAR